MSLPRILRKPKLSIKPVFSSLSFCLHTCFRMLLFTIVDQGMQVRFTHLGCFIEEEGKVIAQGYRYGRIFILNTNDVGTAMFAKGQKFESDIDLWHKWIGHVNYQRFQDLQSKQVVFGLPKFSSEKAQIVKPVY